jgi:hypothetical protein
LLRIRKLSDTDKNTRFKSGTKGTEGVQMGNETNKAVAQEPFTYSIPVAGGMAGLAKNASYAAARRGEIPVIKFGGKRRVPANRWRRILAEGRDPLDTK